VVLIIGQRWLHASTQWQPAQTRYRRLIEAAER